MTTAVFAAAVARSAVSASVPSGVVLVPSLSSGLGIGPIPLVGAGPPVPGAGLSRSRLLAHEAADDKAVATEVEVVGEAGGGTRDVDADAVVVEQVAEQLLQAEAANHGAVLARHD